MLSMISAFYLSNNVDFTVQSFNLSAFKMSAFKSCQHFLFNISQHFSMTWIFNPPYFILLNSCKSFTSYGFQKLQIFRKLKLITHLTNVFSIHHLDLKYSFNSLFKWIHKFVLIISPIQLKSFRYYSRFSFPITLIMIILNAFEIYIFNGNVYLEKKKEKHSAKGWIKIIKIHLLSDIFQSIKSKYNFKLPLMIKTVAIRIALTFITSAFY